VISSIGMTGEKCTRVQVVAWMVGINNLRTGFDGIERIGTGRAFGVT
jgi:hypothetical protein